MFSITKVAPRAAPAPQIDQKQPSEGTHSTQDEVELKRSAESNPFSIHEQASLNKSLLHLAKTPAFYVRVGFLNKACRVGAFDGQGKSSSLRAIIVMMIKHFSVKLDSIASAHILSTQKKQILWEDHELEPEASYFLCFARKGFILSQQNYKPTLSEMPQLLALTSKQLSSCRGVSFSVKRGFQYEEGVLEELHIHHKKGSHSIFTCPFLDCATVFQNSCDLTVHFNYEIGHKPYVCDKCGFSFRRNLLLKKHQASRKCKPKKLLNKRNSYLEKDIPDSEKSEDQKKSEGEVKSCIPRKQGPEVPPEEIQEEKKPVLDVVKEEVVSSSPVKKRITEERPPLYLLSLQVAQTVKNFHAFNKLSDLQERGALKEQIQIQKVRLAWEMEMTGLLLREKW